MFFRPTYPISKNQFIKSTLGLVAIILRKGLPIKKEGDAYYSEGEYILKAKEVIEKEFNHIIQRLGLNNNKKEEKDGVRKEEHKNTNG